jgi:hypothetical protein
MTALVEAGAIRVMHRARLSRIEPARVIVEGPEGEVALRNDRVILILGYEPSSELFDRLGIAYDPATLAPRVDPISLESSVPGVFLAGIILSGRCPDRVFIHGSRNHGKAIVARILGKPPLPIEDRGLDTSAHWQQFEAIEDEIDAELALDLVPVVVGDHRDNLIDVHAHWARATGRDLGDPQQPFGSVLDAMQGWWFRHEPDGTGVLRGWRCSRDVLDLLRRADGTRRIRDIIEELAGEIAGSPEEIRAMVVPVFLELLRAGTIAWRASRLSARVIRGSDR